MRRPPIILSHDIGTISHRRIRAAVKKVMAQREWEARRPVGKITRKMTASGRGAIAFKVPRASKSGSASHARKRG